jgi:hypothetical protein
MMETAQGGSSNGPRQRSAEIAVAVAMAFFAVVVIAGSMQAGISWGAEGPQAGFVPFYVGALLLAASVVNLAAVALQGRDRRLFAQWDQLVQVMWMLVPTAIYVAAIPWIGIYVSSALLIAWFMRRLGGYGWALVSAIAIGVPLVCFVIFERWFLVALPKGPLEAFLGY